MPIPNWQKINGETLKSLAVSEGGVSTLLQLQGEDGIAVVNLIDQILP